MWLTPLRFWSFHSFRALPSRNHLVSDLFQSHTCGFFSAFTRATCSLSVSSQYLGLGFNAPYSFDILKPNYSHATRLTLLSLRGCHSLWPLFPEHSAGIMSSKVAPHLIHFAMNDSVRPLPVSLVLLTESHKLSSPACTKIFQFHACAHASVQGVHLGNPKFKG